jgi:glycosyltransferase involved in cell wall biosynthesis
MGTRTDRKEALTFSVVLPYYNEADFLPETLASWLLQEKKPRQMILVDNGSTDGSDSLCRRILEEDQGIDIIHESEARPGKIHALKKGCEKAAATHVVLADADTFYPPDYLSRSAAVLAQAPPETAALAAVDLYGEPEALTSRMKRHAYVLFSKICKKQTLTGGYGQIFRTDALEASGGFSADIWPYVLLDHEIMHRVLKQGSLRCDAGLWCRPSTRRRDRRAVRWSLFERFLYRVTPFALKDWYFYTFLGPRFEKRGLTQLRLREKTW